jgi:hypothetical protein
MLRQRHLDPAYDQERTEQVENPVKALYQRNTGQDHGGTHGQRSHDAPIKYSMLIYCRDAKVRKDRRNHKDVVQTERFFDHITCEEENCRRPSVGLIPGDIEAEPVVLICKIDEDIEGERNTDPCAAQNQRFFKRYRVSLAVKYPKIYGK